MTTELQQSIKHFHKWRCLHKRGRLPNYLKQQAILLATKYGPDQIASQLQINITMLRPWLAQGSSFVDPLAPKQQRSELEFMPISLNTSVAKTTTSSQAITATISSRGISIQVEQQPIKSVISLLKAFNLEAEL